MCSLLSITSRQIRPGAFEALFLRADESCRASVRLDWVQHPGSLDTALGNPAGRARCTGGA
jgi:hypothetical protein